jgi:hypothetical protein
MESLVRGGYRGTEATARFTAQLVWLDTPEIKDRVKRLASRYRVSQARILRAVAVSGLGALELGLADGSIRAETLV